MSNVLSLLGRRAVIMAGKAESLPYDAEIKYLKATGTQYIDTGITGSQVTRFVVVGSCDSNAYNTSKQLLGGSQTNAISKMFGCIRVNNVKTWSCRDSEKTRIGNPTLLSKIDATINSASSQTGTLTKLSDNTTSQFYSFGDSWAFPATNLLIFGGKGNYITANGCCASLQLYTSEGLVRDLISVRVGTVGYMYDKVSGELFGNAGTGDFVLGDDVTQ